MRKLGTSLLRETSTERRSRSRRSACITPYTLIYRLWR